PLRKSVSSLCRGHANLLCIVPNFSYVTPKGTLGLPARITLRAGDKKLTKVFVKYHRNLIGVYLTKI
ncbi:hypothetical protein K523DRAFT_379305, partial [Schizophyllum commune Tattone D]